ncbi:hypothetical protein HOY80DRAFT_529074 [Tuber brumale]|nr:hypothetical protein HOY80DRAFT_529074 [Tuber brumale]
MGNICSRDEPIRERKFKPVELRNDIARLEGDRGETEARASVRKATACGGGGGSRTPDPTAAAIRRSRTAGLHARPEGSRNFKVLEELEARRQKTRKAERDRS